MGSAVLSSWRVGWVESLNSKRFRDQKIRCNWTPGPQGSANLSFEGGWNLTYWCKVKLVSALKNRIKQSVYLSTSLFTQTCSAAVGNKSNSSLFSRRCWRQMDIHNFSFEGEVLVSNLTLREPEVSFPRCS